MSLKSIWNNFWNKYSLKDVIADHILNRVVKASKKTRLVRIATCRKCPNLIKATQQCAL